MAFWGKYKTFDRELNIRVQANIKEIFKQMLRIITAHNILNCFCYLAILIFNS